MTRIKKVTIADVAAEAGVARSTVSKVVNGTQKMLPETTQRVWKAVSKLGYQASPHAQSLGTGRTKALGIVILDILNPHFTGLVKGAGRYARENGYVLLLADAEEDPKLEQQLIETLLARTDGIILAGSRLSDQTIQALHHPDKPIVTVGRVVPGVPSVVINEFNAAYHLTQHLASRGAKHITYLAGPRFWVNEQRQAGYTKAVQALGLESTILNLRSPDIAGGEEITGTLAQLPNYPDAIICYNDLVAVGLSEGLRAIGKHVPSDVKLAAFGTETLTGTLTPTLTHIEVPNQRLGAEGVQLLIQQIEQPPEDDQAQASQLELHATLRTRPSTETNGQHAGNWRSSS